MNDREVAVLITGSNMGNRSANLAEAAAKVRERVGNVTAMSSVAGSEPWGEVLPDEHGDVQDFLNQVLVVETMLGPEDLLRTVKAIEREMGRRPATGQDTRMDGVRQYRSRLIDIDILFYGEKVVDTGELRIPHPLMHKREFVLRPLCEVMPGRVHPETGKTVQKMLEECLAK